jgi:DNA-binding transcriptional regulator YiaG
MKLTTNEQHKACQSIPTLTGEEWRPVVEFPEWYEVSNFGRVRRVAPSGNQHGGLPMIPNHAAPYPFVALSIGARQLSCSVHVLVAAAFIGACPEGKEVNHINGVKTDNRVSNLEYLTHPENVRHSREAGLVNNLRGSEVPTAKLDEEKVREIVRLRGTGLTQKQVAARFGVKRATVASIDQGVTWRHVTQRP